MLVFYHLLQLYICTAAAIWMLCVCVLYSTRHQVKLVKVENIYGIFIMQFLSIYRIAHFIFYNFIYYIYTNERKRSKKTGERKKNSTLVKTDSNANDNAGKYHKISWRFAYYIGQGVQIKYFSVFRLFLDLHLSKTVHR